MDIEIENAIKIHKTSLPNDLPNKEKISFSSLYIPAQELGGDLFHVFKVDNGLLDDFFEQLKKDEESHEEILRSRYKAFEKRLQMIVLICNLFAIETTICL